jgi:hypothetical protein
MPIFLRTILDACRRHVRVVGRPKWLAICFLICVLPTGLGCGRDSIEGVQARYFLPLLPFLIFILPWLGGLVARLPRLSPGWFCLPAVAMAVVNSYALPAYIYHLFRMPGP